MALQTPTTELEAVNRMLSAIGETPVNSLDGSGVVDAVNAQARLQDASREVQQEGWRFNTETNFPLSADTLTGDVRLPRNCLQVDAVDCTADMVQRGLRLYDVTNHTYDIGKTVKVNMVVLLDFEDLPEPARNYITIRAARKFIDSTLGSTSLHGFEERDELMARANLKRSDTRNSRPNIFRDSPTMVRMRYRGGSAPLVR